MSDAPPIEKRKLRVTSCVEVGKVKSGKNAGNPIYKVEAQNEHGAPIPHELRSFQECPVGDLVEYGIKFYKNPDERYPDSFTLFPPKERLGKRVEELEQKFTDLEARIEALEGGTAAGPATPPPVTGADWSSPDSTTPPASTPESSSATSLPSDFG